MQVDHETKAAGESAEPLEVEQVVVQMPQLQVELQGASIEIVADPRTEGAKLMVVGPIMLQLIMPLDGEASAAVAAALNGSSIIVAPAGALPRPPA